MHMSKRLGIHVLLGSAAAIAMYIAGGATARAQAPLAMDSARITISGSSNIHAYTASTSTVRVTRASLGAVAAGPDVWANALKPGAVDAFEISIPAATLTSPTDGLDKNMHKALKVNEHADITFRLVRVEADAGGVKAIGTLRIAGVERDVALALKTQRTAAGLTVRGDTRILMTDYGIKPPTAMLGMLKTDPNVTVAFEVVLAIPLT
jgi:polyisoprenoid-binding protein YceI